MNTRAAPDLVQVVGMATTLYARADVDQLLGLLGAVQVSGVLHGPNLPAPLAAAVAGRWVSVPGASGLTAQDLPDKTVTVDEYVRDGIVSAFRFDLTQLLNPAEAKAAAGRPAVLQVALSPTASVTAPSSAMPLDGSALTGPFGQALGGLLTRPS